MNNIQNRYICNKTLRMNYSNVIAFIQGKSYELKSARDDSIVLINEDGNKHTISRYGGDVLGREVGWIKYFTRL